MGALVRVLVLGQLTEGCWCICLAKLRMVSAFTEHSWLLLDAGNALGLHGNPN